MCTISFVWCRSVSIFHATYGKFDVHSSWVNWKNSGREQRKGARETERIRSLSSESFIFHFVLWWCSSYRHSLVTPCTFSARSRQSYLIRESATLLMKYIAHFRPLFVHMQRGAMRSWACVRAPVKQSSTNPKTNSSPCMPIFQEEIRSSSQSVDWVQEQAHTHNSNEMRKSRQWKGFWTVKIKNMKPNTKSEITIGSLHCSARCRAKAGAVFMCVVTVCVCVGWVCVCAF